MQVTGINLNNGTVVAMIQMKDVNSGLTFTNVEWLKDFSYVPENLIRCMIQTVKSILAVGDVI